MQDEGFKDFKLGYEAALDNVARRAKQEAQQVHENIIWREIRDQILFRKFSPVTGYEPDPKREEWKTFNDCRVCPWFEWRFVGWDHGKKVMRSHCLRKYEANVPLSTLLGDPSFCRFGEYRRILFRKFRRVI